MLSKLLKHEFRATGRILLPLLGAELLLSLLAGLSIRGLGKMENMGFLGILYITTLFVFFLGLFAVFVVAFVLMIQRFYRSLLRDEGYLSMTLPVSVDEHIFAKLITSLVWLLGAGLLCALALFVMIRIGADFAWDSFSLREILQQIPEELRPYGGQVALFALEMLLLVVFGICTSCLQCYAAMAVGCSAANHKVLLSFVAYFLMSLAQSAIQNGLGLAIMPRMERVELYFDGIETIPQALGVFHGVMGVGILFTLLYGAIFYFVTRYFLKNKLNLA